MKPLRLSVYSYLAYFFNDYIFWFDERLQITQTIADLHTCFLLGDTCKQMQTSSNYIKMKEISIFHQYFGTIDAFIYKAYYIDF